MTVPVNTPPLRGSRRALLAGALGGLGALAAGAIGRVSPTRAANGDPVVLGLGNAATSTTEITNLGPGGGGLRGLSSNGPGIEGVSNTGIGVQGLSTNTAVRGESSGAGQTSVHGHKTTTGHAVFGQVNAPASGWAATVGSTNGIGPGVFGLNTGTGDGVWGHATSGVGLFGQATGGFALRTSGRTKLSTSGVATIVAGNKSKTVTPGVDISSASFVLLTPKANIGSRALWFTTDLTNNKFTIRMGSSRASNTKVAWLLLG